MNLAFRARLRPASRALVLGAAFAGFACSDRSTRPPNAVAPSSSPSKLQPVLATPTAGVPAPTPRALLHPSYPTAAPTAAGPDAAGAYVAPLRVDVPDGYDRNPTALATPLRQDFERVRITPSPTEPTRATFALEGRAPTLALGELDLAPLLLRVPKLARGDAALTRLSIIQQEFNRLESRLPPRGALQPRLANNCLRTGLWEVMLGQEVSGQRRTTLLAWFEFPLPLYVRAFERMTGLRFADFDADLRKYPELNGLPVPLDVLRKPLAERSELPITLHRDAAPPRLDEQRRKHPLVTSGAALKTLGDFVAPAAQPVLMAKFDEPGFYNVRDPMKFDLRFLATPKTATWRRVAHPAEPKPFDELELTFADGRRLLLGHARLARLEAREAAPTLEDETLLRLTFGIGTQEIYMEHGERAAALARDEPQYLMLLDRAGVHVDNHFGGLDRVYLWRQTGPKRGADTLHVWLIGYERIAVIAHYTLPFAPPLR